VLPDCLYRRVAAIGYWKLKDIDLGQFTSARPPGAWKYLAPAQKASLERLAWRMKKDDLIFVKEGPNIVARGTVTGPYQFNGASQLLDGSWQHEIPVVWDETFAPVCITLGAEQFAVKELTKVDVDRVMKARPTDPVEDSELMDVAWEGAKSLRLIQHRHRGSRFREAKIAHFRREHRGRLFCEVKGCGFDFEKAYAGRGGGYAHVHHTRPLATFRESERIHLDELVVVCANCHSMIHRYRECLALKELEQHMRG
jgi:predicted HNH restriction endonuclease